MDEIPSPYKEVFDFHGHRCPTVIAGALMAQLAMEKLNATKADQFDLFARVEYDWCGVDGIQYVTGCTFGNRNIKVHPRNVWRMQLVRKSTGEGVEVDLNEGPDSAMNDLTKIKLELLKDQPTISKEEYDRRKDDFRKKTAEVAMDFVKLDFHKAATAKKTTLDWKNTR